MSAVSEESFAKFDDVDDWMNFAGTLICICLAALAAGLTMGIVSLESLDLRVKMRTGTPKEKRWAGRLLPLVELVPHHQVLVTLLLVNSLANEALPLFLDALVPSWAAIVISVTVVLFVGELIPSAIFTGPFKLEMAARCAPLAFACLFLASPIAYPLAVVLDRVMPEEISLTTRDEVAALVEIERDLAIQAGVEVPFSADAVDIVGGTMGLHKLTVADCCLPVEKIFSIPSSARASIDQLRGLADAGYSRVPITDDSTRDSMRRYLLVKELVGLDPDPHRCLTSVTRAIRQPLWTGPSACLFALLNEFQTGTSHIAFVSRNPKLSRKLASSASEDPLPPEARVIGIITLEDIMETIIQEEIYDEADRHVAARRIANFFLKALNRKKKIPVYSRRPPPTVGNSIRGTQQVVQPRSTLLAITRRAGPTVDPLGVENCDHPSHLTGTRSLPPLLRAPLRRAASDRRAAELTRRGERYARGGASGSGGSDVTPGERDALLSPAPRRVGGGSMDLV